MPIETPPLADHYKKNFDTLCRASDGGALMLVSCIDKKTQKPVAVICAVNRNKDDTLDMVPLAKMFDGNPYMELENPVK